MSDLLAPPDPARLDAVRRYRRRQRFDPAPRDEDPVETWMGASDWLLVAGLWVTTVVFLASLVDSLGWW